MVRFEVHISDEGFAGIDGEPLVPDAGRSVHEAVLDRLRQYAEQRGAPVEATVNDGPGTTHFVLQVAPDGSSRVVIPTDPASDRPATGAPPSAPLPADLAEPITRINALTADGRLDEASAAATALRENLTASLGAEHPDTLEARAMEAYLAHLRGDHREATVLALDVARTLCRTGDAQAPAAVARAAAAWRRLDDDRTAVTHGRELLRLCDSLHGEGLLPPGHADLARRVRRRLEKLTSRCTGS
ncbi:MULTISPECIES: tetratricopeptide repeat protein [unclassified Streptomyces]|uniref:tetratricopeptide repeat protein n=1 Tax=unclassified Streptomyces TaxID=2593676 RepID=UPI00093BF22C|nr:tetratricopeptide repeat protein [Streptomyces sp. CB02400]